MTAPPHLSEAPDGVAAWRRIADALAGDIAAGRLTLGGQLPTEARLAERFGVNRHTVRRALQALAARGMVRATQGRGTFVEARPVPYPVGGRARFSEAVARAGREPSGELLAAQRQGADPVVAAALGLTEASPVISLRTLRRADGAPLSIGHVWLPLPRFEGIDRHFAETGSHTESLRRLGIPDYRRVETRVTARHVEGDEGSLLDLPPGRVVLVVGGVNVDSQGRPVQFSQALFAADRVELVFGD